MDLLGSYGDDDESLSVAAAVHPRSTAAADAAASTATGGTTAPHSSGAAASHRGASAAAPRLLDARVASAPPVGLAVSSLALRGAAGSTSLTAYGGGDAAMLPSTLALRSALDGGVMTTNLTADQLWSAAAGPINPYAPKRLPTDKNHTVIGAMQAEAVDPSAFDAQFNSFNARGVAQDPTGSGGWITNAQAPAAHPSRRGGGGSAATATSSSSALAPPPPPSFSWAAPVGVGASVGRMPAGMSVSVVKRRREHGGDIVADPDSYRGPWAGYEGEAAQKVSVLSRGELTDAQKKLRIDQGYHADKAGKLKDTVAAAGGPAIAGTSGAAAAASNKNTDAPAKSGTAALIREGAKPEYAGGGSAAQTKAAAAAAASAAAAGEEEEGAGARPTEIEALEAEALRRLRGGGGGRCDHCICGCGWRGRGKLRRVSREGDARLPGAQLGGGPQGCAAGRRRPRVLRPQEGGAQVHG